jgi:hypothetical protein
MENLAASDDRTIRFATVAFDALLIQIEVPRDESSVAASGPTVWSLRSEPDSGPCFRFGRFLLTIFRAGRGFEGMQKPRRDRRDFSYGGIESLFVGLRRFVESADLTDELQGRGADLVVRNRRIKIKERFDVSAHSTFLSVSTGLEPGSFLRLNAALKRRSSTHLAPQRGAHSPLHSG